LLRKWLCRLARVTFVLAIGLAVAASAFAIWWLNSLNGLPDIGDPFDVAAFRSFSVPDDQNAFTFVRRANEKLTPLRGWRQSKGTGPDDPISAWSIANPKLREWARENREALELFLQGADRPDAAHPAGEPTANAEVRRLNWVAIHEARRRQESGDMAGAWDCYRAVLRMITHCRRRGSITQRYSARQTSFYLPLRLTDWVTDPRTTPAQLHAALDEVLKNEPNPDWNISAIKHAYLELMREIERPMPLFEEKWTFGLGDLALTPTMIDQLKLARRFMWREPERSRRVLRLLFAQYLAHLETRELPPRKPAVWVRLSYLTSTKPVTKRGFTFPLYPVSPEAPVGARALSPQAVAGWLVATLDARVWLERGFDSDEWPWPPDRAGEWSGVADDKAYRDLVIMLATKIYLRERGSSPASDEALVGTYLKRLPVDRAPEVDDGTAPKVE
jgi:hypothetical protein